MSRFSRILNIDILRITHRELLARLSEGALFTPNVDHLFKLQHDKALYDAYQQAEWVVCDSRILYIVSKLLRRPIPEPIPGSSFFRTFCEYHRDDAGCRIFLLGAREGVAAEAMRRVNGYTGRRMVVGAYSLPYAPEHGDTDSAAAIERINASGATVLVVGMGCPKQEKWIARYRSRMPGVKLFMALGATIDFEAGNIKRAPRLLRTLALEWLYRFLQEPKRLFRRYFIDDTRFFGYYARQLLGLYRNPFA